MLTGQRPVGELMIESQWHESFESSESEVWDLEGATSLVTAWVTCQGSVTRYLAVKKKRKCTSERSVISEGWKLKSPIRTSGPSGKISSVTTGILVKDPSLVKDLKKKSTPWPVVKDLWLVNDLSLVKDLSLVTTVSPLNFRLKRMRQVHSPMKILMTLLRS